MTDSRLAAWVQRGWYQPAPPAAPLRVLSRLYGAISSYIAAKRKKNAVRLPVPVIVVGNLSVGGTGKTPVVVWLVEALRARGLRPGVISRGYGGRAPAYPLRVDASTDPKWCGDEPALLARRLGVPLAVAPDRVAAGRCLLAEGGIDVLVTDDGLQHYRLARDAEICVVDGRRGLGNGQLLPVGPLRELPERLATVDCIVVNGSPNKGPMWQPPAPLATPHFSMQLVLDEAVELVSGQRRPLRQFAKSPVHALAGIGDPQRFFGALRDAGLTVDAHPFADHHAFVPADLAALNRYPLLMTEKDAVKCAAFATPNQWYVPVSAEFEPAAAHAMRQWLDSTLERLHLAPK